MSKSVSARVAFAHRICTGIPEQELVALIGELAPLWIRREESRLRERRGGERLRLQGAGPAHVLGFIDRVVVTLVVLRFQLPHAVLALFYGVDRATVTRAVGEIRPLLAGRGFAVPGRAGVRLRTLADVFAYAAAEGVELRIDGTEVQVRRPRSNRPGRRAFVSGKRRQNTIKPTVISDAAGRMLWCGAVRPGRMHDVTALRTEGIEDLLRAYPQVKARVDAGYQGLARDFPGQVSAPPPKPPDTATAADRDDYAIRRKAQSSQRICVEHAIAEPKAWRSLQRYIGRREYFADTVMAIAGLVSDRTAKR